MSCLISLKTSGATKSVASLILRYVLTAMVALAILTPVAMADVIVDDDFSGDMLDPVVWNHGGGFFHNTDAGVVLLSTFGSGWGSKGDQTGAAGLNSDVGYASFTVTDDGDNPIGGNFNIGKNVYTNTGSALVRINLALGGPGTYEVVWNNSGVDDTPFEMGISGWTGMMNGHSSVWIVDGDTMNPNWASTDAAPDVNIGDAANRFGFWNADADANAVIDNVVVWDMLTPPTGGGLSCDFDSNGTCDIADLNLMLVEGPIASGVAVTAGTNDQFDLNGDNVIDNSDRDSWLTEAATENGLGSPYKLGDANLDGVVDVSDFGIWNSNKFTNTLLWSDGDFTGDGVVDVSDFGVWNGNKFTSSDSAAAVPEPGSMMLLMVALVCLFAKYR